MYFYFAIIFVDINNLKYEKPVKQTKDKNTWMSYNIYMYDKKKKLYTKFHCLKYEG